MISRYTRTDMGRIWSDQNKFQQWLEVELAASEAVARAMARTTKLPPYVYTTSNARRVGESGYVWARNLLANRLFRFFYTQIRQKHPIHARLVSVARQLLEPVA